MDKYGYLVHSSEASEDTHLNVSSLHLICLQVFPSLNPLLHARNPINSLKDILRHQSIHHSFRLTTALHSDASFSPSVSTGSFGAQHPLCGILQWGRSGNWKANKCQFDLEASPKGSSPSFLHWPKWKTTVCWIQEWQKRAAEPRFCVLSNKSPRVSNTPAEQGQEHLPSYNVEVSVIKCENE